MRLLESSWSRSGGLRNRCENARIRSLKNGGSDISSGWYSFAVIQVCMLLELHVGVDIKSPFSSPLKQEPRSS